MESQEPQRPIAPAGTSNLSPTLSFVEIGGGKKRRPVRIPQKRAEDNQGQCEPSEEDMSDFEEDSSDESSDESA